MHRTVASTPVGIKRRPAWRAAFLFPATLALGLGAAGAARPLAAQAPDEAWRSLRSEHFRISFPERLEPLARRAGAYAEQAWASLAESFPPAPSGVVDLVVTDHTDVPNGFARVTPWKRITVFADPPVDDLALGYFDAWMQLVVTHELAHVFHLDRTGFVGRIGRTVFGRTPTAWPTFPGTALPRWTTEGLATWYESSLTGSGRVHGTYHEMVVRTAAWEDAFADFDQAAGSSPVWPGADLAYTYGSLFFEWLLEEHGAERMAAFADAVAGQWIPYRLDAAGKDAFGVPLSSEWARWTEVRRRGAHATAEALRARAPLTEPERLVRHGRFALYPRVSRDGTRLAWASSDGRSDVGIRTAGTSGADGTGSLRTNGLASFDWLPDGGLLFAQLEMDGPYRSYEDLWVAAPDGATRRVTRGARLDHPSASPDGLWAVAVRTGDGTNALVRVDLAAGGVTVLAAPDPDVHWAFPDVSPDGRWIAVSRWTRGGLLDVVVLDASGRVALEVTHDRAMDVAPAWSPDGRWLVWGSDRNGIPEILAAEVDPGRGTVGSVRQATNLVTGAAYPTVDPDGRWLTYSGYHADGWEVERIPYAPSTWPEAPPLDERFGAAPAGDVAPVAGDAERYSPFPTLLPRYWEPLYREPVRTRTVRSGDIVIPGRQILGASVGAETSGFDIVERHGYDAFVRAFTTGGVFDAGLGYSFYGLGNPVFSVGGSQLWDEDGPRIARADDTAPWDTLFVRVRERNVSASVSLTRPRWRDVAGLTLSGGVTWEHRELLDEALEASADYALSRPDARFSDVRATLSFSTARSHAFQTGAAEGVSVVVRGRRKNELGLADSLVSEPGLDRSLEEVLASGRGYLSFGGPGFASHVLAVRVAGGAARGPGANAGHFEAGGASGTPESITGLTLFGGTPLFFPVRGYPRASRVGRYAWSAAAEYRFPLRLVNQGLGPWPLHLDRVTGALFVDAGNAWGPELGVPGYQNPRGPAIAAAGVELTAGFLALWRDPILVRGGVALPFRDGDGAQAYVRVGLPF